MSAETMRDAASDPIQMLWIGELSKLERMALASFVANGHIVHLYAYDELAGVPAGVQVIDAREILPEERIFRYGPEAGAGEGSLANFANLFRYKLLYERGGWWVDADVVCLRPFDFDAPTLEALRRPDVWGFVRRLADELERVGDIQDEVIDMVPERSLHWPPSPQGKIARPLIVRAFG
jgi:hypothetical protein